MDIEGYGEFGGISEEDDDIARFERQCAERARAEGALPEEGSEDEDEQIKRKRLVTGQPQDINEWQEKCELLHDKLGRKEGELAQVPLPQEGTICIHMHGLFPACCCLIWKALCRSLSHT